MRKVRNGKDEHIPRNILILFRVTPFVSFLSLSFRSLEKNEKGKAARVPIIAQFLEAIQVTWIQTLETLLHSALFSPPPCNVGKTTAEQKQRDIAHTHTHTLLATSYVQAML